MELVKPEFGLIFWTSLTFLIVMFLLVKFAWKPILTMIKEREHSIEEALNTAEKARAEMKSLQASNDLIVAEAKAERDLLMKEAREMKEKIIAEAKAKASSESEKIIASAIEGIQNEKMAAITELKNQVATLSIEIAEKILKQELSGDDKQKTLLGNLLEDVNLN